MIDVDVDVDFDVDFDFGAGGTAGLALGPGELVQAFATIEHRGAIRRYRSV